MDERIPLPSEKVADAITIKRPLKRRWPTPLLWAAVLIAVLGTILFVHNCVGPSQTYRLAVEASRAREIVKNRIDQEYLVVRARQLPPAWRETYYFTDSDLVLVEAESSAADRAVFKAGRVIQRLLWREFEDASSSPRVTVLLHITVRRRLGGSNTEAEMNTYAVMVGNHIYPRVVLYPLEPIPASYRLTD